MAACFTASVHGLTRDHYDAGQRQAWAPASPDLAALRASLAGERNLFHLIPGNIHGDNNAAHVRAGGSRAGWASITDGREFPFATVGSAPLSDLAVVLVHSGLDGPASESGASAARWTRAPRIARRWRSEDGPVLDMVRIAVRREADAQWGKKPVCRVIVHRV